ncbi:MAG: cytochrome c-type biogenesis protein [Gammaproteobacteria bacterium]
MSARWLAGATLAVVVLCAAAQPEDAEARYHALIAELRCLVCQNQSIAESNAPLAGDLREQVRAQIAAGKTDAEILEFVTARYGDFVRYRPDVKGRTLLLWFGPFAVLLGAASAAVFFIRRSRAPAAPAAPDPQRVRDLLDEDSR